MKSKIVIGVIVLIIIVAGGWYILKMRSYSQPDGTVYPPLENLVLPDAANSASSTQITNNQTSAQQIKKDSAMKTRAMQVIAKPVAIHAMLTDAQKQETIKQIDEIKKQITANYKLETSWLQLGNYRKYLKDYGGAIEAWNFLATMNPKGYLAFHNLGSLYGFELHNYLKSEENFLKAIQNAPSDIDAYSQLVIVYEASTPEKIAPLLLSGIKSNPTDVSLKVMLGQYYTKVGKKSEALKYLEEAIKISPANSEIKAEIEELKK